MIKLKRAYEPSLASDGKRILVERLWPRGVSKAKAKLDLWAKDVAPSSELREWYAHDVSKWPEFKKKYLIELRSNPAVSELKSQLKGPVTFVYATRDSEHSGAMVLKEFLET